MQPILKNANYHRATSPELLSIKKILVLEGLIGSGKTTQADMLQASLQENKNICFVIEPVDEWIQRDFLEQMYTYRMPAFMFQNAALISLITPLIQALNDPAIDLIVCERSIWSNLEVFAKQTLGDNDEYILPPEVALTKDTADELRQKQLKAYQYIWSHLQAQLVTSHMLDVTFVFLHTDAVTATTRAQKRGRKGESGIVSETYQEKLFMRYQSLLQAAGNNQLYTLSDDPIGRDLVKERVSSRAVRINASIGREEVHETMSEIAQYMLTGRLTNKAREIFESDISARFFGTDF